MRSITSGSLATLQQKTGTEPIIIVEVDWVNSALSETIGPISRYSDRKFEDLDGRILQVATIEDIINVSGNGTSQSVNLTLADTDGALKEIFNNTDIHKKRVWIYQWFSGIPITEKFLLFSGIIASPILWKEGDRTLTFTVINKGEDKEIGFSPEEGEFPSLPQNLVGTVWPLVFGIVSKLPFVRVDEITTRKDKDNDGSNADPISAEGTGIADPAIKPHLDQSGAQAAEALRLAQINFLGYLQASGRARRAHELEEFSAIQTGKGPWSSLAKQFLDAGNKYLLENQKITQKMNALTITYNEQRKNEKKQIRVTDGEKMPQGTTYDINLGGAKHTGYFLGNNFVITSKEHPQFEKYVGVLPGPNSLQPVIARDNFFWADSGAPIGYSISVLPEETSDNPYEGLLAVRYIVSSTIPTSVLVVYAERTIGDVTGFYPVPANFYTQFNVMFGTLPVTMVVVPVPLSARVDGNGKSLGWQDELYGVVQSPIGPNTVDILRWIIDTYTTNEIDEASFTEVRTLVDAYPSNFALMDRPQVMQVLSDIAYQARCIIYLKGNTFYIKYKPKRQAPTATITAADIIEQTLEITTTETENLVTKYVAQWVSQYKTGKKNLIILRYNIGWYGTHEKRYDYFIYTQQQLVEKSATFWLIREANTFKYVTLTVPIKFLNIETLDTVTLILPPAIGVANTAIDCVVEEAVIDTQNYTINLKLWVPVRAGEMEEYQFAYLNDLGVQYVFPTPEDVRTNRAGNAKDKGGFNDHVTMPTQSGTVSKPFTGAEGNGGNLRVTVRPHTWGADASYISDVGNTAPTITQRIDTATIQALGRKPANTTTYQLDKSTLPDTVVVPPVNQVIPGFIVSGEGPGPYVVNGYFEGLDGDTTELDAVFCIELANDEDDEPQIIPPNTPVMVTVSIWTDGDGELQVEYTMQPPVWL